MNRAKSFLRQPYARIVIPEDRGFHAEILEFPGCFAQGETLEEAYANLESAAESWIDACLSQGQEVPGPSSTLTYSGRIVLRLPRGIHKRAAQLAERDQTSLNTYLVSAVAAKVGTEDLYNILTERLEEKMSRAAYQVYATQATALTGAQKTLRPLPVKVGQEATTASPKLPLLGARR
jgi:predicted RNase H-like HicB family nuclease